MSTAITAPLAGLAAADLWRAVEDAAAGYRDGPAGEVARLCASAGHARLGWVAPPPWSAVAAALSRAASALPEAAAALPEARAALPEATAALPEATAANGRDGDRDGGRVVLVGTGGWSFAAQAVREVLPHRRLAVLDSLDPAAIRAAALEPAGRAHGAATSGCLAVSGGGGTLETRLLAETVSGYAGRPPVWLRDQACPPRGFTLSVTGRPEHVAMLGAPLSLGFLLPAALCCGPDLERAYRRFLERHEAIARCAGRQAAAVPVGRPVRLCLNPPAWAGSGLRRWLLQLGRQVLCGKPGPFQASVDVAAAGRPGVLNLRLDRPAVRPGMAGLLRVLYHAGVLVGCIALRAGIRVTEHANVQAYKDLIGRADPDLPAPPVTDLPAFVEDWLSGRPDLRRLHIVHYGVRLPATALDPDPAAVAGRAVLAGRAVEVHEGSAWNHHSFHSVHANASTAVLVLAPPVSPTGTGPAPPGTAPLVNAARALRRIAVATQQALADRSRLVEYVPPGGSAP